MRAAAATSSSGRWGAACFFGEGFFGPRRREDAQEPPVAEVESGHSCYRLTALARLRALAHSPAVRIDILSLFPPIASSPLGESMMKRAQQCGAVEIHSHNLRDWARDKHRTTDDMPYGGGQGMVMKCEPIFEAIDELRASRPAKVVLMTPAGRLFSQKIAAEYAAENRDLIILCGHYEGIDQRAIDALVDDEISIGDYVLTNGAIAAVVFIDAIVRLLPGVLGDEQSAVDDSHATGLLEFPQFTRPVEYRGRRVPDILLSGNHAAIEKWRREQALEKTRKVRPDLLEK